MTLLATRGIFKSQHNGFRLRLLEFSVTFTNKNTTAIDSTLFGCLPSCKHHVTVGKKKETNSRRLIRQRAKFSRSVMVSAGVCYEGKGRLHFVAEKVKVNGGNYTEQLLPELIDDCRHLLDNDFLFQQDGAPAHTSKQAQEWLKRNCPEFVSKDEWPPNSPDLNPLDFCVWGVMLDKYHKHSPKPSNVTELKTVLQEIWDSLPLTFIQKAVLAFRKRLQACVRSDGGHFEHLLS
jgi:hypothetical protein